MAVLHPVTIHDRQRGETHRANLPEGSYVLQGFEALGMPLPFSCRNGCCTACAVRVLEGNLEQPEALGLSRRTISSMLLRFRKAVLEHAGSLSWI